MLKNLQKVYFEIDLSFPLIVFISIFYFNIILISSSFLNFAATLRAAQACDIAMLVPKGIDSFPLSKGNQMIGNVDVWCIVHDGGLLLLTSYLLMRNRVWRKCHLRIFVVATEDDDIVNLKKDMTKFMYDLRINASVEVVAMVS